LWSPAKLCSSFQSSREYSLRWCSCPLLGFDRDSHYEKARFRRHDDAPDREVKAGSQYDREQKTAMRTAMNSPVVKGFAFASSFIAPLFVIVLVAGVYFLVFTLVGREGGFKAFLSNCVCVCARYRESACVSAPCLYRPLILADVRRDRQSKRRRLRRSGCRLTCSVYAGE
jgi:hypothetical protein